MAQMSPQVVWNSDCKHHFSVIERRKKGTICSACYECGDDMEMPIAMLAEYKRHLKACTDVQVLLWLVCEDE